MLKQYQQWLDNQLELRPLQDPFSKICMHNLEQSVRVVFQMFQNLRLFTISSDIEHAR